MGVYTEGEKERFFKPEKDLISSQANILLGLLAVLPAAIPATAAPSPRPPAAASPIIFHKGI